MNQLKDAIQPSRAQSLHRPSSSCHFSNNGGHATTLPFPKSTSVSALASREARCSSCRSPSKEAVMAGDCAGLLTLTLRLAPNCLNAAAGHVHEPTATDMVLVWPVSPHAPAMAWASWLKFVVLTGQPFCCFGAITRQTRREPPLWAPGCAELGWQPSRLLSRAPRVSGQAMLSLLTETRGRRRSRAARRRLRALPHVYRRRMSRA